jgi:hypothetical protein
LAIVDFPEAIGPVTRTTEPSRCELSLAMPLIVSPCSGDIPERWPRRCFLARYGLAVLCARTPVTAQP